MTIINVVSVTSGSPQVTRVSGGVWDNVLPGAIFFIPGDTQEYVVATVVAVGAGLTPTTLFLTTNYAGLNNANATASLSIDFTPNKNLPLINTGDIAAASLYNRAMGILDEEPSNVLPHHGPTHRPLGDDPIPFADTNDGGLWPVISGDPTNVLTADGAEKDITIVDLMGYNSITNPNFEIDQRTAGQPITFGGTKLLLDRWNSGIVGATMLGTAQVISAGGGITQGITGFTSANGVTGNSFLRVQISTLQSTLAAGDFMQLFQNVEGPRFRELVGNPHSIKVLVRSTVTGLKFGVSLRDPTAAHSCVQLATIPVPNVWTSINMPNYPAWTTAGSFLMTPGVAGYILGITLAAGTTFTNPSNNAWNNGNFLGAVGQSNFFANPVGSQFDIAFVQHQQGSNCSRFIDIPYLDNLLECQRYYTTSYPQGMAPGTVNSVGPVSFYIPATAHAIIPVRFPRRMARTPTSVVGYSTITGATGTVRNVSGAADVTIASAALAGDTGFNGFNLSAPFASLAQCAFHWTADTGF